MLDKINQLLDDITSFTSTKPDDIENFRIRYLSKKGIIPQLFNEFKTIPNDQKREVGQRINSLKQAVTDKIETLKISHLK